MCFTVQQRTEELAIRSALEQRRAMCSGSFSYIQALGLTLCGGAIAGIPLALALGQLTVGFVFGVQSLGSAVNSKKIYFSI
jgi:ABC-type nickel/cobalt efflux system permease component RcnA